MKRFLDSSVLVESCLSQSSGFGAAAALLNTAGTLTSAHALAEAYATLSGDPRLGIKPADAARMVADLARNLTVHALTAPDYQRLIAQGPDRGIRGGIIYDALHAETARQCGCTQVHTLNVTHFRHVAPDLAIVGL